MIRKTIQYYSQTAASKQAVAAFRAAVRAAPTKRAKLAILSTAYRVLDKAYQVEKTIEK